MNCIQRPIAHRLSDCMSFIPVAVRVMRWGELGEATVMDIGCQTGFSSRFLIENFPNIKKVIGIDPDASKVLQARFDNNHHKMDFQLGNMEDRQSLYNYLGEQQKVISLNGFTNLTDKRKGFENLFLLLKAGGEAVIFNSIQSPYTDFLQEIRSSPRWKGIAEKMTLEETTMSHETLTYYKKMFEDIGFTKVQCYHRKEIFTFSSDKDCKEIMFATLSEIMDIPFKRIKELKEDAFRIFVNHSPRDEEGNLTMVICWMYAFLRKPEPDEVSLNLSANSPLCRSGNMQES